MGKLRCVIRLGDATSHGGKIISASSTIIVRGKSIELDGHHAGCGCALISSLSDMGKS